jgi:hypothetical protein
MSGLPSISKVLLVPLKVKNIGRPCLLMGQQKVVTIDYIEKQSHSCKGTYLNGECCKLIFNERLRSTIIKIQLTICSNHWVLVGRQVAQKTLSNLKKPKKT